MKSEFPKCGALEHALIGQGWGRAHLFLLLLVPTLYVIHLFIHWPYVCLLNTYCVSGPTLLAVQKWSLTPPLLWRQAQGGSSAFSLPPGGPDWGFSIFFFSEALPLLPSSPGLVSFYPLSLYVCV